MLIPNAIHEQRFQKIIFIFLFLLLSVALIITWNAPAVGYEVSIYRSTPLILWVSLISSVIVGITVVVTSAAKNEFDQCSLWKIGFLLIFLSYVVCLALFIIRSYYMLGVGGDAASHIGWIKDILNIGHLPTSLIYPTIHIYLSETILITGLDLIFLHKIAPLIFSLLCILFMYVFARTLLSKSAEVLLAVVISCSLAFGWYLDLTANALANHFLPFALFLVVRYLQQRTWPWTIALVAVLLLYPVFHPVPAAFLGLTFLTLWIPLILPKITEILREGKINYSNLSGPNFRLVLPFLILLAWFIFWISSFSVWGWTLQSIYETICLEEGPSKILDLADEVSYAQGYGYNVIEQVVRRLWSPIILSVLSAISLPLLWRNFQNGHHRKYLFSFYGPFGMIALAIPLLYTFNLAFGPLRLMIYISMLGTVFAAYLLVHLLTREKGNSGLKRFNLQKAFVIIAIFGLFLGGMLNLYSSPYNLKHNHQTPLSEVVGMKYFFEHRDVNVSLSGITITPGRFADAFLTPDERAVQNLPRELGDRVAPWHFGYDRFFSISSAYDEETDLIIRQRDKTIYVDYFPEMAQFRFTIQDFERLDEDPGVNFLYSNGGFDLRKIIS